MLLCNCIILGSLSIRTISIGIWCDYANLDSRVLNPLDTFVSHFLSFNSVIVKSILSHICGRLYFPMFLFRVGLLTLMNMASLMVLAILLSSLPKILKLSIVVLWPLAVWWWKIGEGVFMCSLKSLQKSLEILSKVPRQRAYSSQPKA